MKIDNKHRFLIIAVISVVMIAAYEGYWLSGLYKSQRQSLEMQISSLISKSELAAYSFQLKREQLTDSIAFLSHDNLSKIVSIKRDSSFGNKIRSISVYRRDDFNKQVASSVTSPEFYEMMDSILFQNFKEAGIDEIFRPLDTQEFVSNVNPDSVVRNGYIIVKSTLGKKLYSFDTGLMTGYILLNMSGIIFTSLMVVAIVIFSFWFFINTLKKQMEFDEMKSSFTSNITHELKTPIAVAYAANDALLNYGLADNPVKREEYLLDTKEQLEKLSALVERILSMSMKERGNFRLEVSETNIRDMFEKIVQETRLRTAKACDIQIEADDNLTAIFDAKLMLSVVSTLVDNAVKYSGESVRILLKAIRKSDKLFISVSDNGIGIAQEHQRHVFEKFYRVPHGDVHEVKGYGIGLYFAKTIVERHGGQISLTSTPGNGSTFTIEL
ncbi:HAMP domain-containing histidine kinase [Bacteroides caecigallinarum]|uniref:sensor histidine kinase n=1 Tax=Bacteroides caecigallinarum TaxID=1411144 RepID=UPI0019580F93|nr:HAMP domain-containing sensor histidine kinase [Bacteroides caecigallinarum]MBM6959950.1 HAMP domain-containing histidine kinase [Bacteroides caecigallinarum]